MLLNYRKSSAGSQVVTPAVQPRSRGRARRVAGSLIVAALVTSGLAVASAASPASALSRTVPSDSVNIDHSIATKPRMILRSASWSKTSEATMKKTADDAVSTGLAAAGWNTISFDDTWAVRADCTDWDTNATVVPNCSHGRDITTGQLIPSPSKYPDGLKALGDYLHSKGLYFGVYASGGNYMCDPGSGGHPAAPGSYNHFDTDFRYFASIGADYIKLDYCGEPNSGSTYGYTVLDTDQEINTAIDSGRQAANAINAIAHDPDPTKQRKMMLNLSAPAYANWSNNTYTTALYQRMLDSMVPEGHAYRVGGDVGTVTWASTLKLIDMAQTLRPYAKQGHYLDLDRTYFNDSGLTTDNQLGAYAMWAMGSNQLVSGAGGADGSITAANVPLLNRPGIIAVDQDKLGVPAKRVTQNTTANYDVFSKPLSNGDYAVAILNRSATAPVTATTNGATIGTSAKSFSLTSLLGPDVTSIDSNGSFSVTVPAGSAVMYRLHVSPTAAYSGWNFGPSGSTALNATTITDGDAPTAGNWDGHTLSSDRLSTSAKLADGTAVSVTAGQPLTIGGVPFTWPNTTSGNFDSVQPLGQTVAYSYPNATTVSFLGAADKNGEAGGTITLNYTDGTSSQTSWGFPSWSCAAATTYPATLAFTVTGQNGATGLANSNTSFCIYKQTVSITAGKSLTSITLPNAPTIRILAIKAS